jgi:Flp pilus assembly protein TadD
MLYSLIRNISLIIFTLLIASSCQSYENYKKFKAVENRKVYINDAKVEHDAEVAYKAQDYKQAISLYEQLLEKYPGKEEYILKMADCHRMLNDTFKAMEFYDQIIVKEVANPDNPNIIPAKEGKALCFMRETQFDEAIRLFSEVLAKDAMKWKTINALGVAHALNHNYKEAIEYYDLALSASNNDPVVLNNLALSMAFQGHFSKGAKVLEDTLKSLSKDDKRRKKMELNLALIYGISGKLDEARDLSLPYLTDAQLANNLEYFTELSHNKKLAKEFLGNTLRKGVR